MTRLQLKKIIDVQEILIKYGCGTEDGLPYSYVYKHYIRDRFYITERQMRNYADINAKKMMTVLDRKEELETGQLKLGLPQ